MKELIVYTKPTCKSCNRILEFFESLDIPFVERNITYDYETQNWLKSKGYHVLPVILADGKEFMPGGYNTIKTMRRHEIMERLEDVNIQNS